MMRWAAWVVMGAMLASCEAGDGAMLDERGRALTHPFASGIGSKVGVIDFAPTYSDIAREYLGQLCTGCHAGAVSPKGLDLTEEMAYDLMVGVPSVGRPHLDLVEPGDPDSSYLIIKLEGGDEMTGRQMPRNRGARPQEEIDVVREWIRQGAPRN